MKNLLIVLTLFVISCDNSSDTVVFKSEIFGLWHITEHYVSLRNDTIILDRTSLLAGNFLINGTVILDKGYIQDTVKWLYSEPENSVKILYDTNPFLWRQNVFKISKIEKNYQYWNSENISTQQGTTNKVLIDWTLNR